MYSTIPIKNYLDVLTSTKPKSNGCGPLKELNNLVSRTYRQIMNEMTEDKKAQEI